MRLRQQNTNLPSLFTKSARNVCFMPFQDSKLRTQRRTAVATPSPWVVLLPPLLPLAWQIYYCTEFPLKHIFWRCENANGWWQWMIQLNNDEIWMLNNMNNDAFLHLASRDGATTTGSLHNKTRCTQSAFTWRFFFQTLNGLRENEFSRAYTQQLKKVCDTIETNQPPAIYCFCWLVGERIIPSTYGAAKLLRQYTHGGAFGKGGWTSPWDWNIDRKRKNRILLHAEKDETLHL